MNTLGNQIKERRHLLKIKQQELADLAGVSINTVVAVERGSGNPRMTSLSADDLPARNMQRARAATGCSIKGFEP